MTRRRIVLYCIVAVVVYAAWLIATLPAHWIARAVERASSDKLLVRAPAGNLWAGSARVYARARSGPPLELGELRWKTAWTGILAGMLATDVAFGAAPRAMHVEMSPFGATVRGLDIAFPGRVLAGFAPGLDAVGPGGTLRVRSESLRIESGSMLGLAEVEWRQVRFSRTPGLDLGSHVARLRGAGSKVDIELGTLEGPLRLTGKGTWSRDAGFTIAGSAEHNAQASPELTNFLRAVCSDYRGNRCGFKFAR